ncbi:NifB/NifX family molybdenum-iron cluster-binding protein [Intestinibacillus sp. Marseille-P6563]|uniref:NifB/NifX family molybdenum-iron cluster-binding protein n=1 Tax=Intestinibacillus sp. Marseille-P6563 TaxID=2364792 RepID=UPI000F05BC12|nr:NifB/NifX family molybdenum-iron cluster-binding protein [Intestinibacillus sp. Marseille-P6563]
MMKIVIAYQDGAVADANACAEYLIVTAENGQPTAKELMQAPGSGATSMLTFLSMVQADVFICGALGVALRNALEMLGVVLVPGVTGPAEEAAAKFLVGEKQGDPGILEICREEDPDDPMACMHDCSKCAGCGPIRVPEEAKKNLPDVH